ncbi:hypothetical protein D3C80_1880620 [compost metagenome]
MLKSMPAMPNTYKNICAVNINVSMNSAWNSHMCRKPCSICPPNAAIKEEPTREMRTAAAILMLHLTASCCHLPTAAPIAAADCCIFIPISMAPT